LRGTFPEGRGEGAGKLGKVGHARVGLVDDERPEGPLKTLHGVNGRVRRWHRIAHERMGDERGGGRVDHELNHEPNKRSSCHCA